jgi:hypothetical protein
MPLKNYTTKVPAKRSVDEITEMLQKHGASGVLTEFEKGTGKIEALSFKVELNGQSVVFRLPLRYKEAGQVLADQGIRRADYDEDYVYRVAWRILRDWVDVQMALVELQMAKMEEIFLPYAIQKNGQTLFENIASDPGRLLGAGNQDN